MLSNLSVILKQKKQKRDHQRARKRRSSMSKDPTNNPSTIRSVIGIDPQNKHRRRASEPAQSRQISQRRANNNNNNNNDQGSQGWFQWGLSFLFYDVKLFYKLCSYFVLNNYCFYK